jgi:excisionase family DNA binding protein
MSIEDIRASDLLTVRDVAAFLKISVSGVRRLLQGRQLPFFKVGGSIRFTKTDLVAYLDKRRVNSIDQ